MAVSGDIIASLNTTGSGSAQVQIAAVPASRSMKGMILNGAPQVNVAVQLNVLNELPEWPVTGSETGAVSDGPHPSGTCQLNLSYPFEFEPPLHGERNREWPFPRDNLEPA